jgi:hypothetical protein
MESEHSPGGEPSQEQHLERSVEMEPGRAIDSLPEVLGYVETEELATLRQQVIDLMVAGADAKESLARYRSLAGQVVDQLSDDGDWARAVIGVHVQVALIRRDGGRPEAYWDDLDDALISAKNLGLKEASVIDKVLRDWADSDDREAAQAGPTTQQIIEACSQVLSGEALAGLVSLDLDDEDFLMAVYGELASAGVEDPGDYLRSRGILEG